MFFKKFIWSLGWYSSQKVAIVIECSAIQNQCENMPYVGFFCSFLIFDEQFNQHKIFYNKLVALLLDEFSVSSSGGAKDTSTRPLSEASGLV